MGTRDLRTLWSPLVSLNQERHTQRRKATNFLIFYLLFVTKIRWKVPHENIHGEASVLENFQKKTKSPHFQEGKKKEFWNRHILRRKKNRFWNHWDLWRIWADSKLSFFKHFYERCANPNPLTLKEDDRTYRHLKYYI